MVDGGGRQFGGCNATIWIKHQTLQQPPASNPLEQRRIAADQGFQTDLKLITPLLNIAQQVAPLDLLSHGQSSPASEWVSAECAGVIARLEHVGLAAHHKCPNGMTTTQSLGQGERVGFDPKLFIAPP